MPAPPDPIHGHLGVLRDDGEKVQCDVCGKWFLHLGNHAYRAHGLKADAYRERFGLMQRTKLGGPAALRARRRCCLNAFGTPVCSSVGSMLAGRQRPRSAGIGSRRADPVGHFVGSGGEMKGDSSTEMSGFRTAPSSTG